jgi:hypothetical protein
MVRTLIGSIKLDQAQLQHACAASAFRIGKVGDGQRHVRPLKFSLKKWVETRWRDRGPSPRAQIFTSIGRAGRNAIHVQAGRA